MENEYQEPEEKQDEIIEEHVEIYSKTAIRGFSIFFSPLFGGVLLYRNLRVAGYKNGARIVILFSILYTLVSIIIVSNFINSSGASLAINIIGAFILSDYFFPKYFPDNDYYPKPIWTALGISLLILLGLFLLLYYTGNLPQLSSPGKI